MDFFLKKKRTRKNSVFGHFAHSGVIPRRVILRSLAYANDMPQVVDYNLFLCADDTCFLYQLTKPEGIKVELTKNSFQYM